MIAYKDIRSVHLEISTRCNASCPDCPRNFRGVNIINDNYPLKDMSLEEFQKIFDPKFLQQLDDFLINGNHGDFVTAKDGLAIVEYIRQTNPTIQIRISTNASGKPNIWTRLGELGCQVFFRLDGLADTHKLYRLNTDFDLILNNAGRFIRAGGYAIWSMIKFDHNQHQIDVARELSEQLGFQQFQLVDEGRDIMPVFNHDQSFSHAIGNYQGSRDFGELFKQYEYYKIDPVYNLRTETTNKKVNCFAKKHSQIYVAANGEVYPCCWLGFYPNHSLSNPNNSQLQKIMMKNNALEYSLGETLAWFDSIEKSWQHSSVADGKIYSCNQVCGVDEYI